MQTTAKVIINADDFGMSTEINDGIVRSFENGWVSSATILTNMPAFDEACALAHQNKLIRAIGLHFNLCEGRPLSRAIRSEPRFCNADGQFIFRHLSGMHLSTSERRAVADELQGQWRACLDAGIIPTHLDTHQHTHTAWGISDVIIDSAPELGLRAVRIHWNAAPARTFGRRVYYSIVNARYRFAGLTVTSYGAQLQQAAAAIAAAWFPLEITVHPIMSPDGTVTDYLEHVPMQEFFDNLNFNDDLVSYGDLLRENHRQTVKKP